MNADLFRQAQAAIAQQVSDDEVLSSHARMGKLRALMEAPMARVVGSAVVGLTTALGVAAPASAQPMDPSAARVLGQQVGMGAQAVGVATGLDGTTASAAGRLAQTGVEVGTGLNGNNTAQRVSIGAAAGGVAGAVVGGREHRYAGAALGGVAGALGGLLWDKMAGGAPQQPQAYPAAQRPPLPQPGYIPPQQPGYAHPPVVAPRAPQVAVYDPASLNMHPVIVDVARANNQMGIVAPGTRPIPQSPQDISKDLLLANMFSSIATLSASMGERAGAHQRLAAARQYGEANPAAVGGAASDMARAEQLMRVNLGMTLQRVNDAAARGGYDTRPVLDGLHNMLTNSYVPDAAQTYRVNTRTPAGYRP